MCCNPNFRKNEWRFTAVQGNADDLYIYIYPKLRTVGQGPRRDLTSCTANRRMRSRFPAGSMSPPASRQVRRWQCRWRQHASVKTPACVTTSLKSNAPLKRGHLFEVRPPPGIDPNRNQSLSAHPSLFDRQKGGRLKDEPFATDVCRSHCHYSCQSL